MIDEGRLAIDFDSMNESDVREIVKRPLLHRLGYRHGSPANIRSEVTLRYSKAFLGRKNPSRDPDLSGRPDYVCEVISFGRWVVEVKAPDKNLDRDTVEQAHTYSAHPEIAASFFLLTNGRKFALYETSKLEAPVLEWDYVDLEEYIIRLFNIVGPDSVRKRSHMTAIDPRKPLGRGLSSEIRIVGGRVTYEEHQSDTPLVPNDMINGLALPVTSGWVRRQENGRLQAHVEVAKAAPIFGEFGGALGIADDYEFFSADEYISTDAEAPTIFQNFVEMHTPAGTIMTIPGMGRYPALFGFTLKAFTEAVGFVEDEVFRGTMRLDYDLSIENFAPEVRAQFEVLVGQAIPSRSQFSGAGRFEIRLSTN